MKLFRDPLDCYDWYLIIWLCVLSYSGYKIWEYREVLL